MSEACRILGYCCGYEENEVNNLIIASSVYDIGKIYVPDEILNYPGKLSYDQYEIIKTHATDDFKILDEVSDQLSKMVHDVVRYHHENWDGSGYPEGLKGEEIPMAARIVSVVDVFEVLTHERSYKKAWSFEQAEDHILENSGVKFDPLLVECFLGKSREIHEVFMHYPDN